VRCKYCASSTESCGVGHKFFYGLTWKYFAERPVDTTNTFRDYFHLRLPFGFVGHEHKGLKRVPDMVIHEVDHVKVFAKPPRPVALV
jgi:hypothetical protein